MGVKGSASRLCGLNPEEVAAVPMDQYTEEAIAPVQIFWRKHKSLAANRNTTHLLSSPAIPTALIRLHLSPACVEFRDE